MSMERTPAPPGKSADAFSPPRRSEGPRKVRHGIKLASKLPLSLQNPIASQWLKLIETGAGATRFVTAMEYARAGQTISLDIQPGVVRAMVQGLSSRPHALRIAFRTLSEAQWSDLIHRMAGEAMYAARLLANEMPPAIEEAFAAVGAPLWSDAEPRTEFDCDCTEDTICTHAATVGILLAERLEIEPLLLFTLKGMHADRVLDRLRHERLTLGRAEAGPSSHSLVPQDRVLPPLEACLDEFWHAHADPTAEESNKPTAAHAPHALLRRLGPSPLQGKFPMVGLLASIYDTVSQAARRQRDSAGPDESNGRP